MNDHWNWLVQLSSLISGIAAAFSAWYAMRAAREARAGIEAQLLAGFMDDYAADEMADALRTLRAWERARGLGFASDWLAYLKKAEPQAQRVDRARRRVKLFFEKAVRLKVTGLVRRSAFREMMYVHGLNLYFDVVALLEDALNPTRDKRTDSALLQCVGRYESLPPQT